MKLIHFFHLAQKLFEPDGRKPLSFIKVGMNVHWYLVYNSLNIGLLQSQTWQNWKAKTLFSVPYLVYKPDQQQLIQGTVRQETCTQENCIPVERENYLGLETFIASSEFTNYRGLRPSIYLPLLLSQIRRSLRLSVCAFYIRPSKHCTRWNTIQPICDKWFFHCGPYS